MLHFKKFLVLGLLFRLLFALLLFTGAAKASEHLGGNFGNPILHRHPHEVHEPLNFAHQARKALHLTLDLVLGRAKAQEEHQRDHFVQVEN